LGGETNVTAIIPMSAIWVSALVILVVAGLVAATAEE
jgi:hypothetical protein